MTSRKSSNAIDIPKPQAPVAASAEHKGRSQFKERAQQLKSYKETHPNCTTQEARTHVFKLPADHYSDENKAARKAVNAEKKRKREEKKAKKATA